MYNITSIFHATMGYTDLIGSKLPFYFGLCHMMLYIQHLPCITSSQVFCDLPLSLCPSTTISLPNFLTQLSLSIFLTCPNHLPLCMQFLMFTPCNLNLTEVFLSFCVTLHIHSNIIVSFSPALPSALLSLPRSHREQHIWRILPFMHSENTLKVKVP